MKLTNKAVREKKSNAGFTMVELLVAIAITGILSISLMQIIEQTAVALRTNQASSSIMTNLNMAGRELASDLKKVALESENLPEGVSYRFLGVDGDGKFEYQDTSKHCALFSCPESTGGGVGTVDHLHMHVMYADYELKGDNASERAAVHYFISNKETTLYSVNQYRLIKRRKRHDETLMESGKSLPEIDEDISVLGVPVGLNIDYLSLRYLNESGTWVDSWDSSQPPVAVEWL